MNTHRSYRLAVASLLGIIAMVLVGSGLTFINKRTARDVSPQRRTIAATIFPLADIARHVAGQNVEVIQLLPAGASEHSYTLTPQQLLSIQQASLLFAIGHGLDTWATEPITKATNLPVVTVDAGVAGREFAGLIDPHYWLTAANAQKIAVTVAAELAKIDPAHESNYQANLATYTQRLNELEKELQQQAAKAPQKEFIAMHDAWSYFADHYGLTLVATYEPVEGRTPSIADLKRLRDIIDRYNITAFYSEPQKQSVGAIRFLREEFGLAIRVLDPLGGTPPSDSYINLMRANMDALAE